MRLKNGWLLVGALSLIAIFILVAVSFERQNHNQSIIANNSNNFSEQSKNASESTTGQEGEIIQEINMTCAYCQYLVNETCFNYTCCGDSQCNENESCIKNACFSVSCSSCQYSENHTCINYECCKDEDCEVNQTCVEHSCFAVEERCPQCDPPYISPVTGNMCEYYYCNASTHSVQDPTNFFCVRKVIAPCCGNSYCEISLGENESNCQADCNNISKLLYCETDENCAPCCQNLQGKCMNINYSCADYPTYFSPNLCGKDIQPMYLPCGCINNQCMTVR